LKLMMMMMVITPWRSVLLQKTLVTQLVTIFPALYGTRMFITVFTTARHWSLSLASCIESTTYQPIFLRSSLILSSCLRSGLPSGHFQVF